MSALVKNSLDFSTFPWGELAFRTPIKNNKRKVASNFWFNQHFEVEALWVGELEMKLVGD